MTNEADKTSIRIVGHSRNGASWEGEYLHLPYLGNDQHCDTLRLLWHCGYYDGIINGVCLYQGKRCWFENVEEVWFEQWEESDDEYPSAWEKTWSRRFVVFELSAEDLAHEEMRHAKFQEHVGTHTDYESGQRRGGLRPQEEWSKFYDWAKAEPPRKYSCDIPLAWFGFPGPQDGELE